MTKKNQKKTEHYQSLLEKEKENISLSKKHYAKELGLFTECFNLLTDTFLQMPDILEKPITNVQTCILLNCARILGSMRAYIDLLMRGYYFDANIIRRSLFENVFLIQCFIKDEKYVNKWVKQELKFSKVKEEMSFPYHEPFASYYMRMCDFVHSNIPAILTLADIQREKPEIDLSFTPKIKLDSETALRFFPIIGYMTLSLLLNAFGSMMNPKIKNQIGKSLKKWNIEANQLCDKVDRESKKIGAK